MCVYSPHDQAASAEPEHHLQEDTMHPEIANQLAEFRRAELIAEAAHQPLVREAKQAQTRYQQRATRYSPLVVGSAAEPSPDIGMRSMPRV
jgi:hypothetical protein